MKLRLAGIVLMFGLPLAGCGGGEEGGDDTGDVTLDPPENGHQVAVGPYPVPAGTEVLRCYWVKVPFDMDVTEIEVRYNTGSHHLDIFQVAFDMPDGDFDCSVPEEWGAWPSEIERGMPEGAPMPSIIVGFQNDTVSWALPEGVSYKLQQGQQLMIQSHYANVAEQETETSRMWNLINFHAAEDPTDHAAETVFDEDFDIVLEPHEEVTYTRVCEFPQEVNLIALFGHFHSRGILHEVFEYDVETATTGASLYQNDAWDHPPFYTAGDQWDAPVPVTAIKMVASYNNYEDREIVWGPFVGENEHFETYAFFYPSVNLNWECACYREGERPTDCPLTLD